MTHEFPLAGPGPAAGPARLRGPRDLLNRPLHDLRISVMDRCNFRCPYCMPKSEYHENYRFLRSDERLSFAEIVRLARQFVALGVVKLRLTGGEPLLRSNLAELVGDLTTLPGVQDLALTTNGVLLARHAEELAANGLRRVTVSLDSLDPDVFARMSGGLGSVESVLEGIEAARLAGLVPIKVNAVVQAGVNDHTVLPLIERFRGTGVIVRLIEYMDVGNRNAWAPRSVVTAQTLRDTIHARWPLSPVDQNYPGEVAARYRFYDGAGEVGFISSVSQPFCGSCSRARLSSNGTLYTCLFATDGLDLRAALRGGADDDALRQMIAERWRLRSDRYSEDRDALRKTAQRKVEMYHIGG
jgi:cyclic pyranopterin phosphate synthase